jgi:tripartite-type tricarboxylate transporter receptor subunit TctC
MTRRDALVLAGATLLVADGALAQAEWPRGQAIRIVVPFTAGSGTDVVARCSARSSGRRWAVDRRRQPGRRGRHAGRGARREGPTRRLHPARAFSGPCRQPGDLRQPELRHAEGLTGITALASLPNVLVTAPDRFKDVRDLVEQAKSKPGTLNYGSAGNGSATHMNAEVFRFAAGLQAQHVPFKGTPEALSETMAGRIDWFFAPWSRPCRWCKAAS